MSEPRIRLSLASATVLDDHLHGEPVYDEKLRAAKAELGRAVARKEWTPAARRSGKAAGPLKFDKPSALEREQKRHEKRGKKARRTMEVYDHVRLRAGGQCECGCGRYFNFGSILDSAPEMDDFFGGAKHRNSRECWMLRAECHSYKTANRPSRDEWLRKFVSHCRKYGLDRERYRAQAKLDSREDVGRAAEMSAAGRGKR